MLQVSEQFDRLTLAQNTAEIVAAYVSHNTVSTSDLANLIGTVGQNLTVLGNEEDPAEAAPKPVVAINRSVRKEHLVCLLCGRPQKLLKRHLAGSHDLTPEDYRTLFGLKPNYPMVARGYAEQRSEMAKRIGLGRPKSKKTAKASPKAANAKATNTKTTRTRTASAKTTNGKSRAKRTK